MREPDKHSREPHIGANDTNIVDKPNIDAHVHNPNDDEHKRHPDIDGDGKHSHIISFRNTQPSTTQLI